MCECYSTTPRLEAELLEKVLSTSGLLVVLSGLVLVLLLEDLLEVLASLDSGLGLEGRLIDNLLQLEISGVSGGHDVVEVDSLHEGLDLASLLELGLAHVLHDLSGVAIDTGN
jgi:hypothetical protein